MRDALGRIEFDVIPLALPDVAGVVEQILDHVGLVRADAEV